MNQMLLTAALATALAAPPAQEAFTCNQVIRVDTQTTGALARFVPYVTTWAPVGPGFQAMMTKDGNGLTVTVGASSTHFARRFFFLASPDGAVQLFPIGGGDLLFSFVGGPTYTCRPTP